MDDGARPESLPTRDERLTTIARAVVGLLVLALLYTAYFARVVVIPIALALMLSFLLGPLVRDLSRRFSVSSVVIAPVVVILMTAVLTVIVLALSAPAAEWIERTPEVIAEIRAKLRPVGEVMGGVHDVARQLEDLAKGAEGGAPAVAVVDRGRSLARLFFDETMTLFLGLGIMLGLLLFMLAAGETTLRQAVAAVPSLTDKKRMVEIIRQTEEEISHYLISITLVNAAVGTAVWIAMWLLDMPNPALWGAIVFVLNYIPFFGALVNTSIIAFVALATFSTPVEVLLPPATYLAIHLLQGQIITPLFLSQRLLLNPIAVILSLIFWTWMWGIPGTLLAVPILAVFRIFCERFDRLAPLALLLARRTPATG